MTHDVVTIKDDDDGQRLDRWLRKNRPDLPYALVQKLLRKGQVRIDGKRAKPDQRLTAGQQVKMPLGSADDIENAKRMPQKDGEWLRQFVIFMDDDLLIINKPSGLAVQGGSGLKLHLEMLLGDFALHGVAPRLVHRIDRETSGVLVMARSAKVARDMGAQFTDREVKKTYLALVSPAPKDDKGMIDAPMAKIGVGGGELEKMEVIENGQPAQTGYNVLARGADNAVALVEFSPRTGRTHQIRVHAAYIGSPLLGDKKYGGDVDMLKKIKVPVRVMLHAQNIEFKHPRTGKNVDFTGDLVDDMATAVEKLGLNKK